MGIVHVIAALMVVPGLLLLFNRLSRMPARTPGGGEVLDLVHFSDYPEPATGWDPVPDGPAGSVAEQAERWLQSQG